MLSRNQCFGFKHFIVLMTLTFHRFNFLPYTVTLNYQTTLLSTVETTSIVFFGPFGLVLVFTGLVVVSWMTQRVFGMFPDVGSKFVLAFGIQTILDPFLILVVDAIIKVSCACANDFVSLGVGGAKS